jgi:hypothetical protein
MMSAFEISATTIIYIVGVVIGFMCGDARPAIRIGYALLWPLGFIAFLVTLAILLIASLIAFPMFAAALLAATVILWALR